MFGLPPPFIAERQAEQRRHELLKGAPKRPEGARPPGAHRRRIYAMRARRPQWLRLRRAFKPASPRSHRQPGAAVAALAHAPARMRPRALEPPRR